MATRRDSHGRFARSHVAVHPSGIPSGAALTQGDARRIVRDIANLPVVIRDARGRRRIVSMFEAAVWRIATGEVSRRNSPIRFVQLVQQSAPFWNDDSRDQVGGSEPVGERERLDAMIQTTTPAEFNNAFAGSADRLRALIQRLRRS